MKEEPIGRGTTSDARPTLSYAGVSKQQLERRRSRKASRANRRVGLNPCGRLHAEPPTRGRALGLIVVLSLLLVSIGIVLQIVYKNDTWRRDEIRRNQLFLSQHARTLKAQDLAHRAAKAAGSERSQNTAELVATVADLRLNHEVIIHGSYKGDTPRAGILTSQADATRVPWYLDPPSATSGYEQAFDALKGPTVQPDGLYDQLARLGDLLAEDTPDQTAIDEALTTIDERVDEAAEIYSTASPDLIRNFTETDRLRTQVVLVAGIGLVAAMIILFTVFNAVMQRRRLAWAESHDPLTGLGNRERFSRSVASALRSRETNGVMAILLIDLDSFAELNRVYGAAQGDAILSIVASRLASQLRDSDVAARLGGDVFAVGCGRVDDPLVARSLGQRLGQILNEPIQLDRKNEIRLTATIGIDVLKHNTITLDDSLDNCRLAVRSAKRDAPGTVELFSQSLKDSEAAEAQLQEELRRAIDFGELVVFYQPEVDLATGELLGSEALVRWVHPQHGLIPPTVFIPLAEKTGLVVDLGAYVLIEACRQAGEWVRAYPELVLKMRVNLSARQLESPAIVDLVSQALDISGLEPSRLCLEITESALMTDAESSRKLLERLASLGVRLAIDDFGTGYSSLAYLEQFPVDVLKIDRSFVEGLDRDNAKTAIVGAVIGLARALGMYVTAEGVETDGQRRSLVELGCHTGQGFYFARPEPAHRIQQILDAQVGNVPRLPADASGQAIEAREAEPTAAHELEATTQAANEDNNEDSKDVSENTISRDDVNSTYAESTDSETDKDTPDDDADQDKDLATSDPHEPHHNVQAPGPNVMASEFVANASRRFGIFSNGAPINFDEVADI